MAQNEKVTMVLKDQLSINENYRVFSNTHKSLGINSVKYDEHKQLSTYSRQAGTMQTDNLVFGVHSNEFRESMKSNTF